MLLIQNGVELVDPRTEVSRISSECDAQHIQELVHTVHQTLGSVRYTLNARLALVDDDLVGQVGRHDEVVLDHKGSFLVVQNKPLEDSGADDSLLTVQVG